MTTDGPRYRDMWRVREGVFEDEDGVKYYHEEISGQAVVQTSFILFMVGIAVGIGAGYLWWVLL